MESVQKPAPDLSNLSMPSLKTFEGSESILNPYENEDDEAIAKEEDDKGFLAHSSLQVVTEQLSLATPTPVATRVCMMSIDLQDLKDVHTFKKNYVAPPRPHESVDDTLSSLQKSLENKQIILEDMLRVTKKTKKYVPPGQRYVEPDEPMVREQRDAIQKLENEIERLKQTVLTLDKTWSELKCLDALLENAGRLYAI
jgi:hypothetical protein